MKFPRIILAATLAVVAHHAWAIDITEPVNKLIAENISYWVEDPALIEAIKAQNAAHVAFTQADIDKMDKQWTAEVNQPTKPLIDSVLNNTASHFLAKVKADSKGLFTEIFAMDNKGLNVGQSDVTSDYWQGDEAKFKKTFPLGAKSVFIDKVEKDDSTQQLQSQVSMTVVDPADQSPIGAITIGVNVDMLQ
ncbi:MAG TPA: hypothetical protein VHL08_01760 [Dongiaceae bacterium]|jgi:hypothetical protein|nr:hypothetical protein [Dongiaceae bacterium]